MARAFATSLAISEAAMASPRDFVAAGKAASPDLARAFEASGNGHRGPSPTLKKKWKNKKEK